MGKMNRPKLVEEIEMIIGPVPVLVDYNDKNLLRVWFKIVYGTDFENMVHVK